MPSSKFFSDEELVALTKRKIFIEGFHGLVKVSREAEIGEEAKLRIGSIIIGKSIIGKKCDIGLGGGAIIENSEIGPYSAVTGGGKIFSSRCGPYLRNYNSIIRNSQVGSHFVIRSLAEIKESLIGDFCKLKMFSKAYYTQMGNKNIIGSHSSLLHVKMGEENVIGEYSRIENSIIGDHNTIGNYVHIKGHSKENPVVIENEVKIEDHVVIEAGSHIASGIEIPRYALVYPKEGKTVMSILEIP